MKQGVPYPPIAKHGVIGDRRTAALVAADGTIDWLCLRDYDDDPVFASLVDARRGGGWRMGPEQVSFGRQRYVDYTAVLETTWSTEKGDLELTDAMLWPQDTRPGDDEPRRVVVRRLRCTGGAVGCGLFLEPRDAFVPDLTIEPDDDGLRVRLFGRRDVRSLGIWTTHPLQVDRGGTTARAHIVLRAGEEAWMVLAADEEPRAWSVHAAAAALEETTLRWRNWIAKLECSDSRSSRMDALCRSLVAARLLEYAPNDAMVAAPTLGLPERFGGPRNYDYRYAWIRDASLSGASLLRVGDTETADRYLRWLSGLGTRTHSPLQVVYDVHGRTRIAEQHLRRASGYRHSRPVILGNHAYRQRQLGSLGYLAECMSLVIEHGGRWRPEYSSLLERVARYTCRSWRESDSGVWELKKHRQFVASKVMCWVVLDRAARIANRVGGFDDREVQGWRRVAGEIHAEVLSRGYSADVRSFRQRYGSDTPDAASLLVPLTGFLPPDDPRVLSTLDRIDEVLGFEGFVYRFVPQESEGEAPLPIGQFEGAFLPCTFWMVTARAMAGQLERAEAMLERLEHLGGELGLFAEEVDPRTGEFLGNYPLLFSQVEHIRALVALEQAKRARAGAKQPSPPRPSQRAT